MNWWLRIQKKIKIVFKILPCECHHDLICSFLEFHCMLISRLSAFCFVSSYRSLKSCIQLFHLLKTVISFLKMNIGIWYTIVYVISCWPLFIKVWIWNIVLMWFWNIVLMWFSNIVLKWFSFRICNCIAHCLISARNYYRTLSS